MRGEDAFGDDGRLERDIAPRKGRREQIAVEGAKDGVRRGAGWDEQQRVVGERLAAAARVTPRPRLPRQRALGPAPRARKQDVAAARIVVRPLSQQRAHVNLVVDEEIRPDFEHRVETDPVAAFEGARELPTAVISLELYEDGGV